jgi:hypothetical protein
MAITSFIKPEKILLLKPVIFRGDYLSGIHVALQCDQGRECLYGRCETRFHQWSKARQKMILSR